MTETGRVWEIRGNHVIIAPAMGGACFGCMKEECRHAAGMSRRLITVENPKALLLETGQMVEVKGSGIALLAQAAAAILPPAAGFAAGYTLVRLLAPAAGEGAFAGAGVILLFAAAFIVYRIKKRTPPKRAYTVTRALHEPSQCVYG